MSYPHHGHVVELAAWRRPQTGFTVRDRIDVLRWQAEARQDSECVVLDGPHPADDPEIGDYILVYRRGENWSRWAVTREGRMCRVWCFAQNRAVGVFASMRDALDAAADLPAPERQRAC